MSLTFGMQAHEMYQEMWYWTQVSERETNSDDTLDRHQLTHDCVVSCNLSNDKLSRLAMMGHGVGSPDLCIILSCYLCWGDASWSVSESLLVQFSVENLVPRLVSGVDCQVVVRCASTVNRGPWHVRAKAQRTGSLPGFWVGREGIPLERAVKRGGKWGSHSVKIVCLPISQFCRIFLFVCFPPCRCQQLMVGPCKKSNWDVNPRRSSSIAVAIVCLINKGSNASGE